MSRFQLKILRNNKSWEIFHQSSKFYKSWPKRKIILNMHWIHKKTRSINFLIETLLKSTRRMFKQSWKTKIRIVWRCLFEQRWALKVTFLHSFTTLILRTTFSFFRTQQLNKLTLSFVQFGWKRYRWLLI